MKKSLLIIAAVAMSFVACSKEEIQTVSKGMTLSANVADDNTKATIAKGEGTTWNFAWQKGDVVSVKSPTDKIYDFLYDGTSFKCETAVPETGVWTAVYPASAQDSGFFINIQERDNPETQDGTLESVMKNYLMGGSSEDYEQPETTISIKMTPKIAIVKITNNTANDKMMNFTTNTGSIVSSATNVATIDATGKVGSTNTFAGAYAGTIPAGGMNWYIAPADLKIYVQTRESHSGSKSYTGSKELKAGKVYNVTLE